MSRRLKYALWALGSIWVVTTLIAIPKLLTLHQETLTVKQLFDEYSAALVRQQFDVAYRYCGAEFREATPYDRFVDVQRDLEAHYGHLKAVKRKTYNVDGKGNPTYWKASMDADLLYERESVKFKFVFDKEDDHWVLYGFERAGI
jgi:hypothetical protein